MFLLFWHSRGFLLRNDAEFCQILFRIDWQDHMVFISSFINVMYHIDWFADTEPASSFSGKAGRNHNPVLFTGERKVEEFICLAPTFYLLIFAPWGASSLIYPGLGNRPGSQTPHPAVRNFIQVQKWKASRNEWGTSQERKQSHWATWEDIQDACPISSPSWPLV